MIRRILAVLLGGAVAFGVVLLVETMGHSIYPLPDGIDLTNPSEVAEYIKQAPTGMFFFVLAAWVLAALIGGMIAAWIARKVIFAVVIGVLVLIATGVNLFMIPHPTWFSITGVVALIVVIYITRCIAKSVFRLS